MKQRAKITDQTIRKADGSLRMDAYYYGFDPTGCEPVDRILAAVALAGKLLHHTEGWGDDLWYGDPGPVEIIEHFACEAADEIERLTAENQELRAAIQAHYEATRAEACCEPDLAVEDGWATDRALWAVAGINLEATDG